MSYQVFISFKNLDAAEQGFAPAQCSIGVCCKNGLGMDVDPDQARYWFELAAAQGDGDAAEELKNI